MEIIHSIEQLKRTARVNSSADFSVFRPFLQLARDVFLVRYLGEELVCRLEKPVVSGNNDDVLLEKVRMCLGPMALWLGIGELSVRLGDSGFTVEKRDGASGGPSYVPASDAKIAEVRQSFERRAFMALDLVLEYLEGHAGDFPEWEKSRYYTLRKGNYIESATQFQDLCLVDIGYSRLTFEHLRPLMGMVELRIVEKVLGRDLDRRLRGKLAKGEELTAAEDELVVMVRRFVACKTAEIYTSERSKVNREGNGRPEFSPVIRPLYVDRTDTGNWFADQSEFYMGELSTVMNRHAEELGVEPFDRALKWNREDRRLMCDVG